MKRLAMSTDELALFCRRMGIGLRSGVDILKLLDNEKRSGGRRHRQAMEEIVNRIRAGDTLAEAMKQDRQHFPNLLIQMVHTSEIAGRMDSMFTYMAEYYEQLKKTRTHFLQKISWPVLQLLMAIGIIGLVILIQGILSPNTTYDASSLGLRGFSGFVIYCSIVSGFFLFLALLTLGLWKNWFQCHRLLMPLVQRIPQLGTALVTLGLSRLSMTLSMMLNAGADARYAIKQAFLSTGNFYFIAGMQRAVDSVGQGSTFADAFEATQVLPQEFIDAVRIGELSGTETESLDQLARQYQQRAAQALNTIANIASVVIWLAIVFLIGFMILKMAFQYLNLLNDTLQNPMG
jgi:type IV pilus assembly protein PilC